MSSRGEPGVGDRVLGGLDREHHRVDHEPSADPRDADAGDRDLVLELVAAPSASGGRRGSSGPRPGTAPSRSRRSARTAGPTRPRRARTPPAPSCRRTRRRRRTFTRLVVSRMRSSSSMATIAIRYGGGKLGIHICSLSVNPATTARPDTSAAVHSCERQYGHTALGGWRSSPQSEQRWKRSFPSSPDFQKNSLSSVSSGSTRPLASVTIAPSVGGLRNLPPCGPGRTAHVPRRTRVDRVASAPHA